jgi:hypothetical protein
MYVTSGVEPTAILITAAADPYGFIAVIVNIVAVLAAVGVPLMAHVSGSMTRPAGSDGELVQLVGTSPVRTGVIVVTGVFIT